MVDYLEKGKKLAQDGEFEEALNAFLLALENDKENADLHFYIGLCYSSLEEFPYAKYHYEIALRINPEHQKTKLVWEGLKSVDPQVPPEKRLTRSAASKERQAQAKDNSQEKESFSGNKHQESIEQPEQNSSKGYLSSNPDADQEHHLKLTDDKWEKAFPAEELISSKDESNFKKNSVIFLLGIAVVAVIVFFFLQTFYFDIPKG